MKDEILRLRAEGKSYRDIQGILNCSKSTISYHLGDGQRKKTNERNKIAKAKKRAEKKGRLEKLKNIKIEIKEAKVSKAKSRVDNNRPHTRQRVFKTVPLKLSEKIAVRIDSRTVVYVKKGSDIEKIKEKYKNIYR